MAVISGSIPSFMNGVSQQSALTRLPTQMERQINRYNTVVRGNIKRPPLEFMAKLGASTVAGGTHIINRDSSERYVVMLVDGVLRVFDFAGNEKTVNAPNGWGYINTITDPTKELRFLTVADYTFVVNTSKKVQASGTFTAPKTNEAFVNIVAANYKRTYTIKIDGAVAAQYTTGDGTGAKAEEAANYSQSGIARNLKEKLLLALPTGWEFQLTQNVLYIKRTDGAAFSIEGDDQVNANAMKIIRNSTDTFSDLPIRGPVDSVVEIVASDGTALDNYWVKSVKDTTQEDGRINWKECPKPGMSIGLNPHTMPYVLVRESNGTFTFKPAPWEPRKCGDAKISPDPSFVGTNITDVFFFKNRLGFLAAENVIMSRAGAFFDFYRTTATTLLDDDPIDVASGHSKVSFMKSAAVFEDTLVLFSDETQFRLAGNELLTPKTANLKVLAEYSTSPICRPATVGSAIYFASDPLLDDSFVSVWEMIYDKKLESLQSTELTAHVPRYIPSGASLLKGTEDESVLIVSTINDPTALYIYRYYWAGDQKVQSSWTKWVFDGTEILDLAIINSTAYLVVKTDGVVYLEKMELDTGAYDGSLEFKIALDHRIPASSAVYSSNTKLTTLTFPKVPWIGNPTVVTLAGLEPRIRSITRNPSTTVIEVYGDWGGQDFVGGMQFDSLIELSMFVYRKADAQGKSVPISTGRLQVGGLKLAFTEGTHFTARVKTDGREDATHVYGPFRVNETNSFTDTLIEASGTYFIPIRSINTAATVILENNTWMSSAFISATWDGRYNAHHRGR